ncbi:multicopper oxidase family protein [Methanosphaerula subterraneus]|uniref:multicopper oxidase family protein n=1 Tax=Methanosphaerula subterraneus TaxID=3350244 RepID=UPI003F87C700
MHASKQSPPTQEGSPSPSRGSPGAGTIRTFVIVLLLGAILIAIVTPAIGAPPAPGPVLLDPMTIPKYVNQIDGPPPEYVPVSGNTYEVNATEFTEQILPAGFPTTKVWGYGGLARDTVTGQFLGFVRNSPGPSFNVTRGTQITVKWINELTGNHMFAVDPTLHWANPNNMSMMPTLPWNLFPPGFTDAQRNVPLVTHVHGAEVQSTSDGHPDAWWTANGTQGMAYNTAQATESNAAVFQYPNAQQAATIWYHDHALGITRINVMSGLAGFFLLRDPSNPVDAVLPTGKYDMPIAIQDRTFNADGSLYFPTVGLNPTIHPYWQPEFFGNTIMVNGKVWPNMNVDQGTYRLRLLDGSNARFYTLSFSNKMAFTQIASDGGYLKTPATLTELTMAPGERAEILVDFSKLAPGTKVILTNTAKAPTPRGAPADPQTTGQIMQFTVTANPGPAFPTLPATLNPTLNGTFPNLPAPTTTRFLTLQEVMGAAGPTEILLDGKKWMAPVSENPTNGTTEDWVIINPTADTHPIHLHLVQFQLVSRQAFQVKKYQTDWMALNGMPPLPLTATVITPNIVQYLQGKATGPLPSELGWKDTIQMKPGEVTRIRVRFASQDGTSYPFDPSVGPGYVWHCHIIDHEDNEMMRPYLVQPS